MTTERNTDAQQRYEDAVVSEAAARADYDVAREVYRATRVPSGSMPSACPAWVANIAAMDEAWFEWHRAQGRRQDARDVLPIDTFDEPGVGIHRGDRARIVTIKRPITEART